MSHPSIRNRLLAGTGLAVTLVLLVSMVLIYQSVARMLRKEVRMQLIESAALLAKSSELEPEGVVYEWHEALESGTPTGVPGYFQFWDQKSGRSVASPALGDTALDSFHGELDETVLRTTTLPDGRPAMAAGLLHLPFLDEEARAEMEQLGQLLHPQDFPQVLVCARETATLEGKLARMKWHLIRAGSATLFAIWIAIWIVSRSTLKPIDALAQRLDERSRQDHGPIPSMPADLPVELTGLAGAFNRTLEGVEAARERERQFALHAAHELRTPIAGIQSTLEQAVSRPRAADDLRRRIAKALDLANGMAVTIHSLMRLARVRGGLEARTITRFDPDAALGHLVTEAEERFAERRVRFRCHQGSPVPQFTSDPDLFRVVVSTLLDNAGRYSPEASEIAIHFGQEQRNSVLRISNPAPDFKVEEIATLCEPFQRGRNASTGEGAGLGLSLAKEITDMLGGTLQLRLERGSFIAEVSFPG